MKTEVSSLSNSGIQAQLALCAAALGGAAAAVPTAQATIITTFQNTTIAVPATTAGVYVNLETGVNGTTAGAVAGFDFNPYLANGSTQLGFYWGLAAGRGAGVAGSTTGPYLDLARGTTVGPASTFSQAILGTTGSSYLSTTGQHILGFRFINAAGATNYGYLFLTTTAGTGFPATINGWVFQNDGTAITIPPIPEPGTVASLFALVGGAAAVRQWRRRKAA